LLHICCAPCSSSTIEEIKGDICDNIILFYFNPNITPMGEMLQRYEESQRYVKLLNDDDIQLIKGEYATEKWQSQIAPLATSGEGGARCMYCYSIRLKESFKEAVKHKCDAVSTTLAVSPHKNFEWLENIGNALSEYYGIAYISKKWDYRRSVELSNESKLYRQDYCGCKYSLAESIERKKKKLEKKNG